MKIIVPRARSLFFGDRFQLFARHQILQATLEIDRK
jgi:hypothetical protein